MPANNPADTKSLKTAKRDSVFPIFAHHFTNVVKSGEYSLNFLHHGEAYHIRVTEHALRVKVNRGGPEDFDVSGNRDHRVLANRVVACLKYNVQA